MAQNVIDVRLSGRSQCSAADPVCRDPPARERHTGFMCRGSIPPMGSAGVRPEFYIKPPLGASVVIFPGGNILRYFPQGNSSVKQMGFDIRVFPL